MTRRFPSSNSLILLTAFAAIYLIWGSTYLAIKFAVHTMPPFLMIGSRFIVAGLLVFGVLALRGDEWPSLSQWKNATLVGTLTLGVGTGVVAWAEQWIDSGVAALLITSVPLFMIMLEWKWKGAPRPNNWVIAGLVLGLIGMFVLVNPSSLVREFSTGGLAMLGILLACFSWCWASIKSKDMDLPSSLFMSTAAQMLMGGLVVSLFGLATGEAVRVDFALFSIQSWLGWGYLITFGSIVAYSAYVYLIKHTTPGRLSTYAYVNPIVAVILGAVVAGEQINPRIGIAIVILLTAVVLISVFGKRRADRCPRRVHRHRSARSFALNSAWMSLPVRLTMDRAEARLAHRYPDKQEYP